MKVIVNTEKVAIDVFDNNDKHIMNFRMENYKLNVDIAALLTGVNSLGDLVNKFIELREQGDVTSTK